MKKYIVMKTILAVLIAGTILSMAYLIVVPQTWLYNRLFDKQNMVATIEISGFEAKLNYDCVIDRIVGRQDVQGFADYGLNGRMIDGIIVLRRLYIASRWICGLGLIISIIGILFLKDKKWYHSLNYGGLGAIAISLIGTAIMLIIRPLRELVFSSQYVEILGNDSTFVSTLPQNLFLYMWMMGLIIVLLIGFISAIIHLESSSDYHPHEF